MIRLALRCRAEQAEEVKDGSLRRGLLLAVEATERALAGRSGETSEVQVMASAERALRSLLGRCRGVVPGDPSRPVMNALLNNPKVKFDAANALSLIYAQEWIDKPWRFWIRDNSFVSRR